MGKILRYAAVSGTAALVGICVLGSALGICPAALAQTTPAVATAADAGDGYVRLPGHVLDALSKGATARGQTIVPVADAPAAAQEKMTLTLVLKREDQAGFERYLRRVYDPRSKQYRHFLSQAQLAERFGPSRETYSELEAWLRARGFEEFGEARNRITLTARATRAQVERALDVKIAGYKLGDRAFLANLDDPAVPAALARHIQSISGLSTLSEPEPAHIAIFSVVCLFTAQLSLDFLLAGGYPGAESLTAAQQAAYLRAFAKCVNGNAEAAGYGKQLAVDPPAPAWQGVDGTGQTVGLLEFDTFNPADVADYLALIQAPTGQIDNLSTVAVDGGIAAPGPQQDEVLLDIDVVMTLAPGAKVAVYVAPFGGGASSYSDLYNAMINGGVNVISNSWASCEDQVTLADAQGIDQVLANAAASGIGVFNASGDTGSACLDGAANTISVPADSPHATAVGGTSLALNPGYTYSSETWWDGSKSTPVTGQGGYGTSRFFSQPSYQAGVQTGSMRSIPDVSVNADPFKGVEICGGTLGGCPTQALNGGTSKAAPEWAAFAALLNQAQGSNLGFLNPLLYPLAGTAAFHGAASMGSDFAHVGLGSPDLPILHQKLAGDATAAVSASVSAVNSFGVGGAPIPPTLSSVITVPADGTSTAEVVVTLVDANGNVIGGKTVTLGSGSGTAVVSPASAVTAASNGTASFQITDLTPEALSFVATDTTDGVQITQTGDVTFGVPPASSAGLSVLPTSVPADGSSAATITVTLKDSLGRPAPGKLISIYQGGGQSVVTGPNPSVTGGNGQIQFTATDSNVENVTYTATDVTDGNLPVPGSGTVDFTSAGTPTCGITPPSAAAGFSVTTFASGFPVGPLFYADVNYGNCDGVDPPAFDPSGKVYVPDFLTGNIYQLGPGGGAVSPSNVTTNPALGPTLSSLVYGKDGSAYATLVTGSYFTQGSIVKVDPAGGTIVSTIATGYTCPGGLAIDPLSGDLFFDDECTGAGADNPSVWRISNPASASPTVSVYATLPNTPNGGMAFAPNGTLYAVSGYYNNPTAAVVQIAGTNTPSPAVTTTLPGVSSDSFFLGIGTTNSDGSAKSLLLNQSGANGDTLETVDITTNPPTVDTVLSNSSLAPGVIGPDGCMYIADLAVVYKLTPSSGSCGLTPTSPAPPGPQLALSPGTVATSPAQGSAQTFTATLSNVSSPAGTPIIFAISGANPQVKQVNADASGKAALTYTAVNAGTDTIVASTAVSGATPSTGGIEQQAAAVYRTFVNPHPARVGAGAAFAGRAPGAPVGLHYAPARGSIVPANRGAKIKAGSAATAAATIISSNPATVTWTAGPHVTFLTLNPSATTGTVGLALTVAASLADVSANPAAALASQTVSFTLDGASCTGTTNASGLAGCALTPGQTGTATLSASFAGTTQYVASNAAVGFNTLAAQSSSSSSSSSSGGSSSSSSGGGNTGSGGGGGGPVPPLLVLLFTAAALYRAGRRGRAARR